MEEEQKWCLFIIVQELNNVHISFVKGHYLGESTERQFNLKWFKFIKFNNLRIIKSFDKLNLQLIPLHKMFESNQFIYTSKLNIQTGNELIKDWSTFSYRMSLKVYIIALHQESGSSSDKSYRICESKSIILHTFQEMFQDRSLIWSQPAVYDIQTNFAVTF